MSGERWDEITQWVDAEGRVALGELASRFAVSEMTIRRDLDALTAAGRLRRVRGGAVSLAVAGGATPPASPGGATPPRPAHPSARLSSSESPTSEPAVAGVHDAAGRGSAHERPDVASGEESESGAGGAGLPSPGFDPSRAPASLGSVIASWAGAFPSGFPTAPSGTPDAAGPRSQPLTRDALDTDDRRNARLDDQREAEAPPGWDLPPSRPSAAAPPDPPARPAEDPWVRAAHAALGDLAPGSAVLLTGGTGALALAHRVARLAARSPASPLTVAVTALAPATVLAGAPGVRLVVLGGEAEPAGTDLVGPSALAALEDLHLDVAVLTPTGLDARGAWAPTSAAAALVSAAVARAERSVAVVAPGALGRPGLVRAAALGALDQVVAVPAPGEDPAALASRLEAVRSAAPSAPRVSAA